MRNKKSSHRRKKGKQHKKFGYLKPPTYDMSEESLLVEAETLGTGFWRALRIFYEYMRGFYIFRNVKNCITVFGSARFKEDHPYYQLARSMGQTLAEAKFAVMTGGGPGIMEAANRGAKEKGGLSLGCSIYLPEVVTEWPNCYVDKKILMHYFFVRKVMLTKYSSAFIVMPGGFGTLDELFEMLTLIQTKKIKNFPVVMMGKAFWTPLLEFIKSTLLAQKTISIEDMDKILLTDSPKSALNHIVKYLGKMVGH